MDESSFFSAERISETREVNADTAIDTEDK